MWRLAHNAGVRIVRALAVHVIPALSLRITINASRIAIAVGALAASLVRRNRRGAPASK